KKEMNGADALRVLTEKMYTLQLQNIPVCNWPDIAVPEAVASNIAKMHTVRQVMSTDVLTVYPEDPVALVARIMEWNDINHIIVEDRKGHIHGVITSGHIMELKEKQTNLDILPVKQVMRTELHTTSPDAPIESALEIMQTHWISSLPVVSENKLMGIVTKNDMLRWMSLRDKR
ncbi:MAG TPA: CBS domain-containing protein, partial [Chitinophagales bacterium]|nr:CBS domain-containing protein [Chitinophagales bacterium]